jgi:hypothetical protein
LVDAKFRPEIVTNIPDDIGALSRCKCDVTGASNVNNDTTVPIGAGPTIRLGDRYPAADRHITTDTEVQVVVVQAVSPRYDAGVVSTFPKLRPIIVTVPPAEVAIFVFFTLEITGVSYENGLALVPTTALTVIMEYCNGACCEYPAGDEHNTDVTVYQEVDAHCTWAKAAVGVALSRPKLVPVNVTVDEPLVAPFNGSSWERRGASNEYDLRLVPTVALIVTTNASLSVMLAPLRHTIVVVDLHIEELQAVAPIELVTLKDEVPKFTPPIVSI